MNTDTQNKVESEKQKAETSGKYDPLESLREEVSRFRKTNQFSPMLVTHFYAQAACVITALDAARQRIASLEATNKSLSRQVNKLEDALLEQE